MSLFGTSKELQFGICDCGKPHRSPSMAPLYRGNRKVGGLELTNSPGLSTGWVLVGSLSSSCWALLSLRDRRAPPSGLSSLFNWGFYLLILFLQNKHCTESGQWEHHGSCEALCCCCVWSLSRVRLFCDPMGCSPPGSSVHGISKARILEWVVHILLQGILPTRDWTWVFRTAGRFFTTESIGKSVKCYGLGKTILSSRKATCVRIPKIVLSPSFMRSS